MRAAVVPGFGQSLVIEDRPMPEPGPGQVVVRMEASGLCHTDIHAANGDWPVIARWGERGHRRGAARQGQGPAGPRAVSSGAASHAVP